MKTFKQFQSNISEGKADILIAVAKLAKSALTPKNIANSKKVIRNIRFFPKIVNQSAADAMRKTQHLLRRGKKTKLPNMPKDTKDTYSKLSANRKSIDPLTADRAQNEFTDKLVDLARKRNQRKRNTYHKLQRLYDES
tara:strand:+ start:1313 stop:1726 length:414 start_codon:yes stop_codon:yes gene_type:complete